MQEKYLLKVVEVLEDDITCHESESIKYHHLALLVGYLVDISKK